MPPRWFTLAIVASWLIMAGLFGVTEVWPRLSPSEPLMFPVDVIDEAGQQRELVNYNASKNGTLKYRVEVEWQYHPEDDSFESQGVVRILLSNAREAPREEGPAWLPQVRDVEQKSSYRLTRGGEMKAIDVQTDYRLVQGADEQAAIKVNARVNGAPHAGRFVPHTRLGFPGLKPDEQLGPLTPQDFERDADPVSVLPRGTVLNPLHPPRRFPELADGQHWRLTAIDPLALLGLASPLGGDALRRAGIDAGAAASALEARVQPDLEEVDWGDGGKGVPCRVIRCQGGGPVEPLTFWVRQKDGVVIREDFRLWGDSWSLLRNSGGYRSQFAPAPPQQPLPPAPRKEP